MYASRGTPPSRQDKERIISEYRDGRIPLTEALRVLSGESPSRLEDAAGFTPYTRQHLLHVLQELDDLVGLRDVKQTVRQIIAFIYMQQRRQAYHLKSEPIVLHMVFKGNPGTGKTTVARILARVFRECGLLEKGHLVEVERADLVGEYIGHTAQKAREQIKKALGGVLFIDEAYSLARGGEKDFGREAIDVLVKGMEDYRNQFIAIIAGYEAEMDWFLSTNPGLPSRFPIHLTFADYDGQTLLAIARRMAAERDYRLSTDAESKLSRIFSAAKSSYSGGAFSNARFVRNMVEKAIRAHAVRWFESESLSRSEAVTLTSEDFRYEGEVL